MNYYLNLKRKENLQTVIDTLDFRFYITVYNMK